MRPNTFGLHGHGCSYCGEFIAHGEAYSFYNSYDGPWLYHTFCLTVAARTDYIVDPKEVGHA